MNWVGATGSWTRIHALGLAHFQELVRSDGDALRQGDPTRFCVWTIDSVPLDDAGWAFARESFTAFCLLLTHRQSLKRVTQRQSLTAPLIRKRRRLVEIGLEEEAELVIEVMIRNAEVGVLLAKSLGLLKPLLELQEAECVLA